MSFHSILKTLVPAAAAALLCGSAHAATYSAGDLLLGFVAGGGQGADSTLVVNLGSSAGYRDNFDSGSNDLAVVTIGSQLTAQFGANWYEREDLYVSVFGTASASVTSAVLSNGDPARTLYVSHARTSEGSAGSASSSGWSVPGNTAMTDAASGILSTSNRYAQSTADALNVAVISDLAANTLDEFTRPATNVSFGSFNGGIEYSFGAGGWGSLGAGGVEAALDLYRLQARNNIAGQYAQGDAIREGGYAGTFTIGQDGSVSYLAAAIPEPGAASLLGLVSASLLFRRRRSA